MAFPTDLNELTDDVGAATDPLSDGHVAVHTELATVLEAVMAKVGVDSSAVDTSHDYRITRRVRTDADSTLADGVDLAVGSTNGTKIATATTQKLGFYNATPVVQPSAYTQTYATADKTHANPTATAHTYPASGNLFDAVAADLLINVRTDTVANAVADIVINEKSIADNLNQAIADIADLKQLVNSVIDDLQALGLVG